MEHPHPNTQRKGNTRWWWWCIQFLSKAGYEPIAQPHSARALIENDTLTHFNEHRQDVLCVRFVVQRLIEGDVSAKVAYDKTGILHQKMQNKKGKRAVRRYTITPNKNSGERSSNVRDLGNWNENSPHCPCQDQKQSWSRLSYQWLHSVAYIKHTIN